MTSPAGTGGIHLIHTSNQGPSAARNLCLEKATGDICFVFDADDVACPDRIACQVDYLECNPGTAAVGSAVEFIGRSGQSIDIATFPQSASTIRTMLERGTNALAHPNRGFQAPSRPAKSAVIAMRSAWLKIMIFGFVYPSCMILQMFPTFWSVIVSIWRVSPSSIALNRYWSPRLPAWLHATVATIDMTQLKV